MSDRLLQVNSLLAQSLGEIFSESLELPTNLLATISRVETGADLKTANVYISVLPFSMTTEALAHIIRQRKYIQRELGRKIKLKFTPVINYKADDTEERVSHINRIIDEANAS